MNDGFVLDVFGCICRGDHLGCGRLTASVFWHSSSGQRRINDLVPCGSYRIRGHGLPLAPYSIASSRHASLPSGTYTRRTYWACACFTDHVLDALVVDDISTGDSYYVISSAVLGFGVQELFSASAFGMSTHHASDPIRSYTFTGEGRL